MAFAWGLKLSATSTLPQSVSRGASDFGASLVRFRYDLPGCSPPFDGSDQVSPATGDFYFQASDELVTRLIAEYDYGGNWTISAGGTLTHKNSS